MSSSDPSEHVFYHFDNKLPSLTADGRTKTQFKRMASLPDLSGFEGTLTIGNNINNGSRQSVGEVVIDSHSGMFRVSQSDKPPSCQTSDVVESRQAVGDIDIAESSRGDLSVRVSQSEEEDKDELIRSKRMVSQIEEEDSSNPYASLGLSLKCVPGFFPPSGVFSGVFGGRSQKELEEIEMTRNALAAMWPKIAVDNQKPNPKRKQKQKQISKTDADLAAKVAVAVAEVAAAEAADAAAKAAKAASAAAVASAAASKASATAANAVGAAKYAKSVFATATRFYNPETEPPLDDDDDDDGGGGSSGSGGGVVPIEYLERARKALEYYKDTKGEEFKFVEIVEFEPAILPPYSASHINFTAKLKHVSDSCSKLFFAEIYKRLGHEGDYEVSMCMILDPASQDVMKGCGYYQGVKDMLHPRGVKFWQGPPEWVEHIRRKRSSVGAH